MFLEHFLNLEPILCLHLSTSAYHWAIDSQDMQDISSKPEVYYNKYSLHGHKN